MAHQLPRVSSLGASRSPPFRAPSYRSAEALAADGGPVVPKDLPDGAGGVEAFGQQQGSVEEEEGSCAVDEVLKAVDAAGERSEQGGSGARAVPELSPGCCCFPSLRCPKGTQTEGEGAGRVSWGKAVGNNPPYPPILPPHPPYLPRAEVQLYPGYLAGVR